MKDYSVYKLNALRSPIDNRDWKLESLYPQEVLYPLTLDYRDGLEPVRDQGYQGTCVAQVGACMKEWQEKIDNAINGYMSPQFIYNLREDSRTQGMYSRDLMRILQKIGSVLEYEFPYESKGIPNKETQELAKQYLIGNYAMVSTIDGVKNALFHNGPCLMTVPVYHYEGAIWKQRTNDVLMGGHAMTIVGYNSKGFIIRNSWGADWGDKGYCIFPYGDWGYHYEVWTTVDLVNPFNKVNLWKEFWYTITNWFDKNKTIIPYVVLVLAFIVGVLIKVL